MPEQEQPGTAETPAGDGGPPKTAKQLEKEAKKAEKLAKLQAKLDKKAAVAPAAGEKKEKPEVSVCAPQCARLSLFCCCNCVCSVFTHQHDSFKRWQFAFVCAHSCLIIFVTRKHRQK